MHPRRAICPPGVLSSCFIRVGFRPLKRRNDHDHVTAQAENAHDQRGDADSVLIPLAAGGATKLSLPTIVNIANALGTTVDDLLCDSVVASKAVFDREVMALLSDCSHRELKILTGTLRSVKDLLRDADTR